jgi:hypothetical protein
MQLTETNENTSVSHVDKLNLLEGHLLNMPQVECPVTHRFGPGIYMREIFIPKGAIILGHSQNFEQVNVLLQGHMTFFGENEERKEATAPATFVGPPGRKLAYAHEDSKFMNIYATEETDITKLEAALVTKTETWLTHSEKTFIEGVV